MGAVRVLKQLWLVTSSQAVFEVYGCHLVFFEGAGVNRKKGARFLVFYAETSHTKRADGGHARAIQRSTRCMIKECGLLGLDKLIRLY